jgi:hypothetical protein
MKNTILVSRANLYNEETNRREMVRCQVLRTRREKSSITGKSWTSARIRDPKGKLWWTPVNTEVQQ